jgi:uncharacterized protein
MTVTIIYSSLLSFCLVYLAINIIKARHSYGIPIGDGNISELRRKIAAQANFCEYTPIFLILLLLVELKGGHPIILHLFAILFTLGRGLHIYSILYAEKKMNMQYRTYSMILTLNVIGFMAFNLLLGLLIN